MNVIDKPKNGDAISGTHFNLPSDLEVHASTKDETQQKEIGKPHSSTYGIVINNYLTLRHGSDNANLNAGSFFSFPNTAKLGFDRDTLVVTFTRYGYLGQFTIGRLETTGRYSYINGCSDSLLVYPPRVGNPSLNHLHIPKNVDQTAHTHPSQRMGVVTGGKGLLEYPGQKRFRLIPGSVFSIDPFEEHKFRTGATHLDVVAFHPDSMIGWTDDHHPMLDGTNIDG
jgi:hypothetical protein